MNSTLKKILELGAELEKAISPIQISMILNDAQITFDNHFIEPKHDLIKGIEREYLHMKERGWDRIFLFFDLHGTVIKPNHEEGNVELDYYPYAKETLLFLTKQVDVDLNIYTCSHEHEIIEYQRLFKEDGIDFKYVNENPDVPTNGYGNYDIKPYMNVLFEDKAGFFGETDWEPIYNFFKRKYSK